MAKPVLLQSISKLSKKIETLLEEKKSLLERVKNLEIQNQELIQRHLKDQEEIERKNKDIEFLSLSHRLADNPEALVSARNKISQLIRTIDSCIRMIKED